MLVNLIIECTIPEDQQAKKRLEEELNEDLIWVLQMDRASNSQSSNVGPILTNSKGIVTKYALWFTFKASNNQAEYKSLIIGLKVAKELDIKKLKVFTDS